MVELCQDHYVVHGFQGHDENLWINHHCKRESLVTYPRVFRYKAIRCPDGTIFIVNEYFSVLCFQPLPGESIDESTSHYMCEDTFNQMYADAISLASTYFQGRFRDADSSLCFHFGEVFDVTWSQCVIQRNTQAQLNIFIEACFLYQLLSEVRRKLPLITENRRSFVFQRTMVDQVEDLFWAETPRGYLVSESEIRIANVFYSSWDISDGIRLMRERFSQSVGNHTFFHDLVARDREQVVSLLLTAIALFQAYGVRDIVISNIPFVSPGLFDIIFLSLTAAVTIAAFAMGLYLSGRRMSAWFRWWKNSIRLFRK